MRFDARHIGSGVWDGGVMSWRGTDLSENEAKQRAADLNVMFDQYGNRDPKERREVQPPIAVESASWSTAGQLDYWVRDDFCRELVRLGRYVIRLDCRDQGQSTTYAPGAPPYDLNDLADDAAAVLDSYGVHQPMSWVARPGASSGS